VIHFLNGEITFNLRDKTKEKRCFEKLPPSPQETRFFRLSKQCLLEQKFMKFPDMADF
jgi:hypothetical protein